MRFPSARGSSVFTIVSQLIKLGCAWRSKILLGNQLRSKNSYFHLVPVNQGHKTPQTPCAARSHSGRIIITLELQSFTARRSPALWGGTLVWNATTVTHQVSGGVFHRYPGVTVVAHHDLVGGHPVAPVRKRQAEREGIGIFSQAELNRALESLRKRAIQEWKSVKN